MFKLIILAVGFVLGGGTGLWLSAAQPELAAKLLNKQNELIEEGKRQAMEEIKTRLDQIVAKSDAAATQKSTGTQILGIVASGGAAPESTSKKEVKALAAELDTKLTELKK